MNRIGKTIFGWAANALKFLQVEEHDHDVGLLEVINPEHRPLEVRARLGDNIPVLNRLGRPDIKNTSGNVTTMTGAPVAVTVPVPGDWYLLTAIGAACYLTEDGTAAASCAGYPVAEGTTHGPLQLFGAPDGTGKGVLSAYGASGAHLWVIRLHNYSGA
jgi:hypothetical protein